MKVVDSQLFRGPVAAPALLSLFLPLTLCAQTNSPAVNAFLPSAAVTDAVYVQIERDPVFDDYVRRMSLAREQNGQKISEYAREHASKTPGAPLPYTELFGVSKEDYDRFSQPMNQFREVTRKPVKIHRTAQNAQTHLDFKGSDLLLTRVTLRADETAGTATQTNLAKLPFVDVEIASLPPGRHRGAHFRTPDAILAATKRRESLLIGELKDTPSGIIHYSINTPGQVKMVYVQFTR